MMTTAKQMTQVTSVHRFDVRNTILGCICTFRVRGECFVSETNRSSVERFHTGAKHDVGYGC